MTNFNYMKRITLNSIVLFTILLAGVVSCEKNKAYTVNSSEKVKKLLEIEARMNAINTGTGKMTSFMSVIGYSQLKDGELSINGTDGGDPGSLDSLNYDTTNYWAPVTCANVTERDNEDGTHTTVYDYGEGCDEFGSLIRGKITYIWKNDNNNYYSVVMYDHYYSYGIEMNGISKYSFTSNGNSFFSILRPDNSDDSLVSIMPVEFNWSGTCVGSDEITMLYDDGNSTYLKSEYSNEWDSISYRVTQGDYYYSSKAEGYEYHYLVTAPLITDYKCTESWVPVSGIETITTTENGETTEYSLNYGTGNCDNLAQLTENGKTSIVDFGEFYKTIDNGDGTVSSPKKRK
jgi:hypothetical protein